MTFLQFNNGFILVVGALCCLLIVVILIALYERKLRRVQADSFITLDILQQKLSALLMNMPGLAYRCHNDGGDWVMEYISQGSFELTGYHPKELIGKKEVVFGELIHPDDAVLIVKEVSKSSIEKNRFRLQYRLKHRDGSYRWVWEQGIIVESGEEGEMLEGFICDITEQKENEHEKDCAFNKLQKLLDEIKVLRGIIPICSSCKNIRNDQGAWEQMEAYIQAHSEADFSHGICPDCMQRLYPDNDLYRNRVQ